MHCEVMEKVMADARDAPKVVVALVEGRGKRKAAVLASPTPRLNYIRQSTFYLLYSILSSWNVLCINISVSAALVINLVFISR